MNIATKGHRGGGIEVESHTCKCWGSPREAMKTGLPPDFPLVACTHNRSLHMISFRCQFQASFYVSYLARSDPWLTTSSASIMTITLLRSNTHHQLITTIGYYRVQILSFVSTLIFIHLPSKMTPQRHGQS